MQFEMCIKQFSWKKKKMKIEQIEILFLYF